MIFQEEKFQDFKSQLLRSETDPQTDPLKHPQEGGQSRGSDQGSVQGQSDRACYRDWRGKSATLTTTGIRMASVAQARGGAVTLSDQLPTAPKWGAASLLHFVVPSENKVTFASHTTT
jgi:hypothetical protein